MLQPHTKGAASPVIANPCVRCGKERIVVKKWQEMIGLAKTTFVTTACPDKECQKIVDAQNQDVERKKQLIADKQAAKKSLMQRNAALAKSKKAQSSVRRA